MCESRCEDYQVKWNQHETEGQCSLGRLREEYADQLKAFQFPNGWASWNGSASASHWYSSNAQGWYNTKLEPEWQGGYSMLNRDYVIQYSSENILLVNVGYIVVAARLYISSQSPNTSFFWMQTLHAEDEL